MRLSYQTDCFTAPNTSSIATLSNTWLPKQGLLTSSSTLTAHLNTCKSSNHVLYHVTHHVIAGKSISLASSSNSSAAASGNNEITEPMVRSLAYHGLQSQVDLIESVYRKAVRQLEALAHQAATDAA